VKALVTGAGGFVGRHLVDHLAASGDDVAVTDFVVDRVDITDPEAFVELLRRVRPEVIYHLAGASDVGGSWTTPHETFRANAEGTLNVLWAAREAGVERTLTIGSADVYGKVTPEDLPLTERSPLRPVSPYAASKVAADAVAEQAFRGFGQHVVRTRPFNHLGPGQSDKFVAPALAARIVASERSGEREIRVGNLSPQRDFTDVRDVVRAYRLLVEHGSPGEAYNVCSGRAIAIEQLARTMIDLSPAELELVSDPELQRGVDIPVLLGDAGLLRRDTGWEPEIPIEVTLGDLLDDVRSRVTA
jgi:GDP-4-dehydro-6-deoxy-D-mannose reductase